MSVVIKENYDNINYDNPKLRQHLYCAQPEIPIQGCGTGVQ